MEKNTGCKPFVLPKKSYTRSDQFPAVRVKKETYDLAADMAVTSGLSMSEVIGKALRYAADNLIYLEE